MYSADITRQSRALFIIMIDQSGSMDEKVTINSVTLPKAEHVARVANGLIAELTGRCRREEGVRDYFEVAAIGYGDDAVRPLLGPAFEPLTPSRLEGMDKPRANWLEERRLPDGATTIGTFGQTLWIEPCAAGNTPMMGAMDRAHRILKKWTARAHNRGSFPPVVINISDGEATDAAAEALLQMSENIRATGTSDGNTLFINIHITGDVHKPKVLFPCSEEELPADPNALLLYRMSSAMPQIYEEYITEARGDGAHGPFRGVTYNTPVTDMVAMMNVGSISVSLFA